jgi:hypothetical protein
MGSRAFHRSDGQGKTDQFANSKNGFQDVMKKQPKKLERMTMGQDVSLHSDPTKADANTHFTSAYIREMAHELAELARSAGHHRLSALLTLASIEAVTGPDKIVKMQLAVYEVTGKK